jgi:glycosyltransferase involved in cell wall biosynthesis
VNIVYFSPTSLCLQNGIARRLTETVRVLREMGDQVMIVAPRGSEMPSIAVPVLTVPSLPLPCYAGFQVGLPYWSKNIQEEVRAFRPDVVHMLDPVTGIGWLGRQFARHQRTPLVVSYHTHLPSYLHYYGLSIVEPLLWRCLQQMFAHASMTLCPSTSIRDQLEVRGFGLPIHLWPSGVDDQRFSPTKRDAGWRERLTAGHSERCILLAVGRMAAEKNFEDLFNMLPLLPGCHLALVGDGPYVNVLQEKARDLPVTFLGSLQGEDLSQADGSADIFVQPSRSETFGNVTLEAMASGLVVVAAAAGGSLDLISHEQNGLLYNGWEEGVQALRRLQQQPFRTRLADTALLAAHQRGWWAITNRLRQLYTALLEAACQSKQEVEAYS